jgi:hypothetical protein
MRRRHEAALAIALELAVVIAIATVWYHAGWIDGVAAIAGVIATVCATRLNQYLDKTENQGNGRSRHS